MERDGDAVRREEHRDDGELAHPRADLRDEHLQHVCARSREDGAPLLRAAPEPAQATPERTDHERRDDDHADRDEDRERTVLVEQRELERE